MVELDHVVKQFDDARAVDDISLSIEAGTIVGLIGPSGCGKSTLVRLMLGIIEPTSGTVRVFGRPTSQLSTRARNQTGYMPQLPVLFPNLSVGRNLSFVASLYGVPWRGRRKRIRDMLELVDLTEHRSKPLSACSGGMQRRLSLAATLIHSPSLLFLDEPTAGVDPILRERFWERFRELRNRGNTVVVPTQYVGEAVSCDQVAVISDGRLIAFCSPDELRREAFSGATLKLALENGWISTSDMARIEAAGFVQSVRRLDDDVMVVLADDRHVDDLDAHLRGLGLAPASIEPVEASFDQIFVELIERDRATRGTSDEAVMA